MGKTIAPIYLTLTRRTQMKTVLVVWFSMSVGFMFGWVCCALVAANREEEEE